MTEPLMSIVAIALLGLGCGGAGPNIPDPNQPLGRTSSVPPISSVQSVKLPQVDNEALRAEDARRPGKDAPLRFAVPIAVRYAPETHGTWHTAADGTLVWRLRIHSPGATSLNFGFTRYRMPRGGKLFIWRRDGRVLLGPFTEQDNERHGQLWTPTLQGDEVVVEVNLPASERSSLELELTSVNHGYR